MVWEQYILLRTFLNISKDLYTSLRESIKDFKKGEKDEGFSKSEKGGKGTVWEAGEEMFHGCWLILMLWKCLKQQRHGMGHTESQRGEYLAEGQFALGSAKKRRQSLMTTKS